MLTCSISSPLSSGRLAFSLLKIDSLIQAGVSSFIGVVVVVVAVVVVVGSGAAVVWFGVGFVVVVVAGLLAGEFKL